MYGNLTPCAFNSERCLAELLLFLYSARHSFDKTSTTALAGLLVVLHFLKTLEQPFLVALFLKTAKGFFKWFVGLYAYFGQGNQPPFRQD